MSFLSRVALGAAALCALLVTTGCVDPIDLDVGEPSREIVIVGQLAEGPGPHAVDLTRSGSFQAGINALRPRESGALVVVEVGDGTEVTLPEVRPGRYESLQGDLIGEVGQTYALRVVLQDGSEYRSPDIEMPASTELVDVRASLVDGFRLEGDVLVDDPSIEIVVDADRYGDQQTYYRWKWSGVYSRDACYRPDPTSPIEFCDRCYMEIESSSLIEIADDGIAAGNLLTNQTAATLSIYQHGFRFVPAFYLVMEQQALTPEAYGFWSLIREARDNVGSLFDPPAEATNGNMVNVDNPNDRALGYFTVVGTSTNDVCVRRDDFPDFPTIPAPQPVEGQCGVTVVGSLTPPPGFVEACARP